MRIRLVRKLAESIDGVDLSACEVGDLLDLPHREAQLLIAEQWAVKTDGIGGQEIRHRSVAVDRALAADEPARRAAKQLRRVSQQLDAGRFDQHECRRTEDRLLEELYDDREQTVSSDEAF